jgi:vacuolar-type H+-ATPase subunit C/Vma6
MKKSDLIAKLATELELALRSAVNLLDEDDFEQTIENGLIAAGDLATNEDIDEVIAALQGIGE